MNNKVIFALLVGGAIWYLSRKPAGASTNTGSNTEPKRSWIESFIKSGKDSDQTKYETIQIVRKMLPDEINAVYSFLYDYISKGLRPPAGSALAQKISMISAKYNIFT